MDEAADGYFSRLKGLVGKTSVEWKAHYPVSEAMIHHWCDAMVDGNPIYTDPEFAAQSSHGGLVAPPTMLQAWTMPGLKPTQHRPGGPMIGIFEEAGFTGVVATNSDQEYLRYLRVGDVVTSTNSLESVSDLKKTALGQGHFVTQLWEFRDASGELVGTMRFRMLFFRPAASPDTKPRGMRPHPAMTADSRFFWEGVRRGELLFQRCADCGQVRHPPGPMCPECRSLQWEAMSSAGKGIVFSFVRHFHPNIPPFEPGHPVALIELDEGVRLVSDLVGIASEDVGIGLEVEVEFNRFDDDLVLPQFRPRRR
jgi:uncharacterized OB-fold protein/acyl dehydratase